MLSVNNYKYLQTNTLFKQVDKDMNSDKFNQTGCRF